MAYQDKGRYYVKIIKDDGAKTYTYDWLNGEAAGQRLLKLAKEKDWGIFCVCNGEPGIPMHIAKYKTGYKIRNNRNDSANCEMHNINCPKHGERAESSPRKPYTRKNSIDIIQRPNGTDVIHFNSRDFEDREVNPNKSTHRGKRSIVLNKYTSVFKIGEMLLSTAWKNYIKTNGSLPKEGNLFHLIFNDLAENCYIKEEVKLSDVMFIPRYKKEEKEQIDITPKVKSACSSIYMKGKSEGKKGNFMYIIAKLKEPTKYKDLGNNVYEIDLIDPYRKDTFKIRIDKALYKRNFKERDKVINADYYISCYVKTKYNPSDSSVSINVVKMAAIPVMKDRGIYVQSSKEIEFAEMLINKKTLFLKPSQSNSKDSAWGKYIPDFLLLDNNTKEITTIVEVFGFYTEEYKKKMELKIKHFKQQNRYKFLYWKANEKEPIPEI